MEIPRKRTAVAFYTWCEHRKTLHINRSWLERRWNAEQANAKQILNLFVDSVGEDQIWRDCFWSFTRKIITFHEFRLIKYLGHASRFSIFSSLWEKCVFLHVRWVALFALCTLHSVAIVFSQLCFSRRLLLSYCKGAFCTLNWPQAALVCRTAKSHSIDHSSNNRKQLENILLSSCLLRNKIIIYDSGRCKKKQTRLPDLALFKWNSWESSWCAFFRRLLLVLENKSLPLVLKKENWPRRLAGLLWRQTPAFELSGQGLARTKNAKLSQSLKLFPRCASRLDSMQIAANFQLSHSHTAQLFHIFPQGLCFAGDLDQT